MAFGGGNNDGKWDDDSTQFECIVICVQDHLDGWMFCERRNGGVTSLVVFDHADGRFESWFLMVGENDERWSKPTRIQTLKN